MEIPGLEHRTVGVGAVSLHVATAGEGVPVVLLHGFPEFWYGWSHQIGPLARAGFRVIAPDQRGYNLSDKPSGAEAYGLDSLTDDVVGLLDSIGCHRAAIVGHDWGGIVAWWLAVRHPGRVDRLAILNAPHPAAFRRFIRRSPRQMLKSWYTFFFQIPWLPEAMLRQGGWRRLRRALERTSLPGTFREADMEKYIRAWSQPGAITAMVDWYRAPLPVSSSASASRIAAPTLIIWGARDTALDRPLAEASLTYCERGRLEMIDDATHWVHHERPELVNRLLIEFLHGQAPGPPRAEERG